MIHHMNRSIPSQQQQGERLSLSHSLGRQYTCPSYRSSEDFASMKLLRGYFDSCGRHSAIQPENKKPETLSSKQFGGERQFITRHVAYAASHNGINKLPRGKSSRFYNAFAKFKVQSLVAEQAITFYHKIGICVSAISNTAIKTLIML